MSPRARLTARLGERSPLEVEGETLAAVAAVLRDAASGPEVLFIRRAENPNDPWSGHMAFPGGRHEASDDTLRHTAARETLEEIGLDLARHGAHLGALDDVPTYTTGLVVRPHVYWLHETPPLNLDPSEVAGVHWSDVGSLMRGDHDTTHELVWKGQPHSFPAYSVTDRVVWGLTYRMLEQLFPLLRD